VLKSPPKPRTVMPVGSPREPDRWIDTPGRRWSEAATFESGNLPISSAEITSTTPEDSRFRSRLRWSEPRRPTTTMSGSPASTELPCDTSCAVAASCGLPAWAALVSLAVTGTAGCGAAVPGATLFWRSVWVCAWAGIASAIASRLLAPVISHAARLPPRIVILWNEVAITLSLPWSCPARSCTGTRAVSSERFR